MELSAVADQVDETAGPGPGEPEAADDGAVAAPSETIEDSESIEDSKPATAEAEACEPEAPEPAPPVMLIEGHVDEELWVDLTDSDVAELARKAADLRQCRAEHARVLQSKTKALKGTIAGIDGELEEIDELITSGRDLRTVRCAIWLVGEPEVKRYIRTDTGGIVREVPLTERELAKVRQRTLPLDGSAAEVRLVKANRPSEAGDGVDAGEPQPTAPPSRNERDGAMTALSGPGSDAARAFHERGYLDPTASAVEAEAAKLHACGGDAEAAVAVASNELDCLELDFAAWLGANPVESEQALSALDGHAMLTGVTEIDQWREDIREQRAALEAALVVGADAAVDAPVELPLPEGVTLLEPPDAAPMRLPAWHLLVVDGNLAAALGEIALHLGGASDYDESEGTRICSPIEPRRLIFALRSEDAAESVGRVLDADDTVAELQRYVRRCYETAAELEAAIATHGPEVEKAIADGADEALSPATAAARAWLVAAERALAEWKAAGDVGEDLAGVEVSSATDSSESVFDASKPASPSRTMRDESEQMFATGERFTAFRAAHESGILDPSESDLREARVKCDPDGDLDAQLAEATEDADCYEADLCRELDTSAKGRMALSRGAFPTGAAKVDTEIAAVRRARARLEVLTEWQTSGAPRSPAPSSGAQVADTPKRKRRAKN